MSGALEESLVERLRKVAGQKEALAICTCSHGHPDPQPLTLDMLEELRRKLEDSMQAPGGLLLVVEDRTTRGTETHMRVVEFGNPSTEDIQAILRQAELAECQEKAVLDGLLAQIGGTRVQQAYTFTRDASRLLHMHGIRRKR